MNDHSFTPGGGGVGGYRGGGVGTEGTEGGGGSGGSGGRGGRGGNEGTEQRSPPWWWWWNAKEDARANGRRGARQGHLESRRSLGGVWEESAPRQGQRDGRKGWGGGWARRGRHWRDKRPKTRRKAGCVVVTAGRLAIYVHIRPYSIRTVHHEGETHCRCPVACPRRRFEISNGWTDSVRGIHGVVSTAATAAATAGRGCSERCECVRSAGAVAGRGTAAADGGRIWDDDDGDRRRGGWGGAAVRRRIRRGWGWIRRGGAAVCRGLWCSLGGALRVWRWRVGVGVGACPGREPVWGTAGRCTADLWVVIAIAIAIAVSPGSFVSTAGRVGL